MRHNLTQNDCFKQILRDPTKPNGKGNYWTVVVDEISGEMYKRQNTSVAYQAPEGKTYVADLRQVYDFYTGRPKAGIVCDPDNPLSLFENTILQDISSDKVTSSSDIHYNHQSTDAANFNAYQLHGLNQNMYMQNMYMQYSNQMRNQPTPNFNPGFNYKSSFGHSPSTVSSPSPRSSFNDSVEQISPNKSIHSEHMEQDIISPVAHIQHQVCKVESTTEDPHAVTRETTVEAVMDYRPKSLKPTLKRKRTVDEIERIEKQSKIKKCKRDLKKFETAGRFMHDDIPPPNVSLSPTRPKKPSYKHSIKNILNLDESADLVNGPPVIDLGEQTMINGLIQSNHYIPQNTYQPSEAKPDLKTAIPSAFSTHYTTPPYFGMYHNPYQAAYMSHLGQLPFLAQQTFSATSKYV